MAVHFFVKKSWEKALIFYENRLKKRLTRGEVDGNLSGHPERRYRREGSESGLRDGTEAGSGNLENDTEKRSEQRQLILRENRANCFVGTETR